MSGELRLSHSSSKLINSCQRKYAMKKIHKVDIDEDISVSTMALDVGKAFHYVLEETNHMKKHFTAELLKTACKDNNIHDDQTRIMIHAMLNKYYQLHEASGLEVVCIETEIEDEKVIGFIDVVYKDPYTDKFYICDMKTSASASFNHQLLAKLSRDPQLNLYSYFVPQICEKYGLKEENFQGVLYTE